SARKRRSAPMRFASAASSARFRSAGTAGRAAAGAAAAGKAGSSNRRVRGRTRTFRMSAPLRFMDGASGSGRGASIAAERVSGNMQPALAARGSAGWRGAVLPGVQDPLEEQAGGRGRPLRRVVHGLGQEAADRFGRQVSEPDLDK